VYPDSVIEPRVYEYGRHSITPLKFEKVVSFASQFTSDEAMATWTNVRVISSLKAFNQWNVGVSKISHLILICNFPNRSQTHCTASISTFKVPGY
jgi:hypothetical protein